jgi:ParB family chromosome partitioning protein
MADKPRRLGRGLEALLTPSAPQAAADDRSLRRLPISQIRPNPFQPRKEFREEDLVELESSLRASGLLQPITVRPAVGSGFELVAGERRLRAATRLGWSEIPAVVREVDDQALLTLALVENLQRADLNPIEEAEGYRRLIEQFGLTQQQVAQLVGKDRSTVANTLRLLALPEQIRGMVAHGSLTAGHARALLGLPDESSMVMLADQVVAEQMSVRELERRVQGFAAEKSSQPIAPTVAEDAASRSGAISPGHDSAEVRRITDLLRRHLQTDISLSTDARHRGQLHISFYSDDDLRRLIELITGVSLDAW